MQLIKVKNLKKIIKYIYSFTTTMLLFEYNSIKKKTNIKKFKIFSVKSKTQAKNNYLLKTYFKDDQEKYGRFKNSIFVFLKNKNKLTVSGWICSKKNINWNIEEIGKNITVKNKKILYDFKTIKKFRNKGYYTLILKLIQNKFIKKKLLIYTQASNKFAVKAILKSGFNLKEKLNKL